MHIPYAENSIATLYIQHHSWHFGYSIAHLSSGPARNSASNRLQDSKMKWNEMDHIYSEEK